MKNKKVKPIISFMLIFLMIFSVLPAYGAAEQTELPVKIETNLIDRKTQLGSRLTFDVWASDEDGEKVDSSVTLNGQDVPPVWNDSFKTSYMATFIRQGENTIVITAGGYEKTYTINYVPAKPGDIIGKAVISAEAFTIGGGYLIDPVAVDIVEGENTAHLLDKVLKNYGYSYVNTGTLEDNFYLSGIGGISFTEADIPDILEKSLVKSNYSISYDDMKDGILGEFDYTNASGWMYCVNNVFPNAGLSEFYLSDGDVIRLQFTLAYGADIGGSSVLGDNYAGSYYDTADKDELTRLISEKGINNIPDDILEVSEKINATQYEVNKVVYSLKQEYSSEELSLNMRGAAGEEIFEGHRNKINAIYNDEPIEAKWHSSDNSVIEIINENKTSTGYIKGVSPGEAYISAVSDNGLMGQIKITVLPQFYKITLKDGTELKADDGRLLVPKGEDTIIISIKPTGKIVDCYENDEYEHDYGNEGVYTLNVNDTVIKGENLGFFLKYFNMYKSIGERYPDKHRNINDYATGIYSSLTIHEGENQETLDISWQSSSAEIIDLDIQGADLYLPVDLSKTEQQFVMNKNTDECEIKLEVGENVKNVYLQDKDYNNIENAVSKEGNIYSFKINVKEFGEEISLKRNVLLEENEGNTRIITFTAAKRVESIDSPDELAGYLCIGSQYSDGGNTLTGIYGLYPEKSLIGLGYWWSPVSLGNFGGYASYYYEKAIEDDPKNPYGIDFIVYGNSNGGTGFSEPGSVLVSEDGETWYDLAGSEHYENRTQWGYKVIYEKTDGGTKANGESMGYWFPSKENYPYHNWGDSEDKVILEGVAIGNGMDAAYPAFGYVDVRTNSSDSWGTGEIAGINGRAKNPYLEVTKMQGLIGPESVKEIYEGAGDCFDLDWAVDKDGMPVNLSKIHYVKIQTASPDTVMGSFGEKSTEVNVVARAVPSDTDMGISEAPKKILIGGKEIDLQKDVYVYNIDGQGIINIEVEANPESNVYINNYKGNCRAVITNKNIIRIIVQDGEKAPLIYYININYTPLYKENIKAAFTSDLELKDTDFASRESIIQALYKLSGEPKAVNTEKTENYPEYVRWAANNAGILIGDKSFGFYLGLDRNVTREEISKILYRYSDYSGSGAPYKNSVMSYRDYTNIPDYTDVSDWSKYSLMWALDSEALQVKEDGMIKAKDYVTYDEAYDILCSFLGGK